MNPVSRRFRWVWLGSCLSLAVRLMATEPGLVERGHRAFLRGDFSGAAIAWEEAAASLRRQGETNAELSVMASLGSAYQAIGQPRKAVQTLESALSRAQAGGDLYPTYMLQAKLGAALVLTRDFERGFTLLSQAMETAKARADQRTEAEILIDLGNLLAAQQRTEESLSVYEEAAGMADRIAVATLAAQSRGNAAAAAARAGQWRRAEAWNTEALQAAQRLGATHLKGFLLLTAGQTDRSIQTIDVEGRQRLMRRALQSFEAALALGREIGNGSIETYALGYLGQLYEEDGQREVALDFSRRAAFVAQRAQVPEAMYRWEWQTGRVLKAAGMKVAAVKAYRRAVQTLDPIRNDVSLGYGNAAGSASFRERVGPLFFELADLLLQTAATTTDPAEEQALLRETRDTLERVKTVELEEYFCDDCVDVLRKRVRAVEVVDSHTAVVYVVPLPERTEVLVGLASGLRRFVAEVGSRTLTETVREFRHNLETRTTYGYLTQAQQIYDWLIRPIRPWIREHEVDTLVLVADGALRTIPFAALHDGDRFLVQDLAVAVAPGLSLVAPQSIERKEARMLLNGVSQPVQGFPGLSFVAGELEGLAPLYPSETLLDHGFTLQAFADKLAQEQYSIVHIASHGKFDRDVKRTFVLTYDGRLTMNGLEALIRPSQYRGRPVELLVLSACQTAAGDDRAALGLAGVAVKAGARSALASLWFVNDQSTSALVNKVYTHLRQAPSVSKAKALQAAQNDLLADRRYRHPCYWSPFLLIGNWL